jgi:Fe2+ or Zn2+ uptake regulation protein
MTKLLEFADSSAISKISLNNANNEVGISFTSKPDNFYLFECGDVSEFEIKVNEVVSTKESLGKFIASSRKDGTLVAV